MSGRKQFRVAIYTRKSSEDGLDQDFNSLDAQREACEAFIASQRELGWKPLDDRYDDGGLSGGTMERPALQRLLGAVKDKRVDIIVVHKIDRLTRSLMDFVRIVEIFDTNNVSFVSVTQQFNTSTSMGRLTLNMLLSFAQFEREITAERIRDKIATSKRKGIWMGGMVPLGYDALDKKLLINKKEATDIKWLFETYLELGSVQRVKEAADAKGIVSKIRNQNRMNRRGGVPLSRGHLYRILSNPIYKGCICHQDRIYPGQHDAIIDETTFDDVQAMLSDNAATRRSSKNITQPHLLTGLLFDETGDRLSPTHASKKGRRYRYYISHRLKHTRRKDQDGWRLQVKHIEDLVIRNVVNNLRDGTRLVDWLNLDQRSPDTVKRAIGLATSLAEELEAKNPCLQKDRFGLILHRVNVEPRSVTIMIDCSGLANLLGIENSKQPHNPPPHRKVQFPIQIRRRGVEAKLIITNSQNTQNEVDQHLVQLIAKSHYVMKQLTAGKVTSIPHLAEAIGINSTEISRILPLAFLAPDIVRRILEGRHPPEVTAVYLKRINPLPIDWRVQRVRLGFAE